MPPKLTRNPNRGKRHAARMVAKPRVEWSDVTVSYMPGKSIDSRIKGIQAYYDRAAAVREIGA